MINLHLEWREVLWWMQGGMAGSHLRWSVYEDMVNKVWPQCTEQERRNIHYIMERDFGTYWRNSEGDWKLESEIFDKTPFEYFRQVLARFDPDNQYAVTLEAKTNKEAEQSLAGLTKEHIISTPTLMLSADKTRYDWVKDKPLTIRAYKWYDHNGQESYFIDWKRRCAPDRITMVEKLTIPDEGTM